MWFESAFLLFIRAQLVRAGLHGYMLAAVSPFPSYFIIIFSPGPGSVRLYSRSDCYDQNCLRVVRRNASAGQRSTTAGCR